MSGTNPEQLLPYLVPTGYVVVRKSDAITPELLEAIRALMRIADHSQLSNTNLDLLAFAVRDTIWADIYPEEEAP